MKSLSLFRIPRSFYQRAPLGIRWPASSFHRRSYARGSSQFTAQQRERFDANKYMFAAGVASAGLIAAGAFTLYGKTKGEKSRKFYSEEKEDTVLLRNGSTVSKKTVAIVMKKLNALYHNKNYSPKYSEENRAACIELYLMAVNPDDPPHNHPDTLAEKILIDSGLLRIEEDGRIHIEEDIKNIARSCFKHKNNKYLLIDPILSTIEKNKIYKEIYMYAKYGNVEGIKEIFDHNASGINLGSCIKHVGLLHVAASYGCKEFIRYLLEKGANVNMQDSSGRSALHYAASGKMKDSELHYAAGLRRSSNNKDPSNMDVIRLLLDNKADVNIKDDGKDTPLWYAIFYGNIEIVRLLASYGADHQGYFSQDKSKENTFSEAWQRGNKEYLESVRRSPDERSNDTTSVNSFSMGK